MHSLKDFTEKVQEIFGNEKIYKTQYIKILLERDYGSHFSFSEERNETPMIYLLNMAKYIVESSNSLGK